MNIFEKSCSKKPQVINLFGGPGCGKSTTASAVFSILKLHDLNVELVTEYAKDLTWESRNTALSNQYYIWGKQHHRLYRIKDQVDLIITDSPLVLSIIYARMCNNLNPHFTEMVLHSFNEFPNYNFVLNRVKKYNPAGRHQEEGEARLIDDTVTDTLNALKIPFDSIAGNHNAINYIVHKIFSLFLGGKPKFLIQEKID